MADMAKQTPFGWWRIIVPGGFALQAECPEEWKGAAIPLYTAPPASGDWGKVREVAADIRRCAGNNNANFHLSWADKLTTALPENVK